MFTQTPIRGFLTSLDVAPPVSVAFQYNPQKIRDKRTVKYASLEAPGILMPIKQYVNGGDRTISFTVRLDSTDALNVTSLPILTDPDGGLTPELNKYRAFMYPKTPLWITARGSFVPVFQRQGMLNQFESPPECLFGLGERLVRCIVTQVDVDELLFNARLAPLRADVTVTLTEVIADDPTAFGGF
jgi:hypothetical protein